MNGRIKVLCEDNKSFCVNAISLEPITSTFYDPPPREIGIKEMSFDEWLEYKQNTKKLDDLYSKNLEFKFEKLYYDRDNDSNVYSMSLCSSQVIRIANSSTFSAGVDHNEILERAKQDAKYKLTHNLYKEFIHDVDNAISSFYRGDHEDSYKILCSIKDKIKDISKRL